MAKIILITTKSGTLVHKIELKKKVTLGRALTCDYPLDDKALSKIHGTLELTNTGKVLYTDNDSSNGSKLHGDKIKSAEMKINDKVKIGAHYLEIDPSNLTAAEISSIGTAAPDQTGLRLSAHTKTLTVQRNEHKNKT